MVDKTPEEHALDWANGIHGEKTIYEVVRGLDFKKKDDLQTFLKAARERRIELQGSGDGYESIFSTMTDADRFHVLSKYVDGWQLLLDKHGVPRRNGIIVYGVTERINWLAQEIEDYKRMLKNPDPRFTFDAGFEAAFRLLQPEDYKGDYETDIAKLKEQLPAFA